MNLVTLYIIIYRVFWWFTQGLLWAGLILFASSVYVQAFANASCLAIYRGKSTLKNVVFFSTKLISMTNDIRTLQLRKKKHNVIYDLRFFTALRTSCRMVLCMSNKRVSFRRVFIDMRKKFELFQQPKKGTKYIVDAVIDPCCDIDSSE